MHILYFTYINTPQKLGIKFSKKPILTRTLVDHSIHYCTMYLSEAAVNNKIDLGDKT